MGGRAWQQRRERRARRGAGRRPKGRRRRADAGQRRGFLRIESRQRRVWNRAGRAGRYWLGRGRGNPGRGRRREPPPRAHEGSEATKEEPGGWLSDGAKDDGVWRAIVEGGRCV